LGKKYALIRFLVENIACTGCGEDMENIMLAMDGVDGATIDYGSGIFSIQYDPEELVAKTIIKKVQSLGFKTQILPDKEHINI
jgi:copper chaperone CopZ